MTLFQKKNIVQKPNNNKPQVCKANEQKYGYKKPDIIYGT